MSTFSETFKRGQTELNAGRPGSAAEEFETLLNDPNAGADVPHQLAICYRLLGQHHRSENMFRIASAETRSPIHLGQILRDWAMLDLAAKRFGLARARLERSLLLLDRNDVDDAKLSEEQRSKKRIEYSVTLGFLGRYEAIRGNMPAARRQFTQANDQLHGKAPYELNNLVWWMKVASFSERMGLARRAIKLARKDNNWVRVGEVVALLFSPTGADKLRPLLVRLRSR